MQQTQFFEKLRKHGVENDNARLETEVPWIFEVIAIHPSYYFESRSRLVPSGQHSAIATDGNMVSPVDMAFENVGVRWGNRREDILDSVDISIRDVVRALKPKDRVKIECAASAGPHGIVEIFEVRSVTKF